MELLAPAGNIEALKYAVKFGADSVYLGLDSHNARMSADNFSIDNIGEWIGYCHLRGAKVYITLNTLIKDTEMSGALDLAYNVYQAGADAVIVQDIGLLSLIRKYIPDMNLHISTQAGVHNALGAQFFAERGASRAVLSRETLLENIPQIRECLSVEAFCHGALCVSFSGGCYYSSLVAARSGNRGRCMQLCRKKYDYNGQNKYFLSPKDLCLIDKISELIDVGVDCIKIEGRMRRPEYAAETVRVYRQAIDNVVTEREVLRLKKIYNRGNFTAGYAFDGGGLIYPQTQNHIGISAGKIAGIKNGTLTLKSDLPLSIDDGFKLLKSGDEIGSAKLISITGSIFSLSLNTRDIPDEVRLTTDSGQISEIEAMAEKIMHPVKLTAEFLCGKNPCLKISSGGFDAEIIGDEPVQKAVNTPVSKESLEQSLSKLGTDYEAVCEINSDPDIFIQKSAVNALRRDAMNALISAACRKKTVNKPVYTPTIQKPGSEKILIISSDSARFLNSLDIKFVPVYSPSDYNYTEKIDKPFYLDTPPLLRGKDIDVLTDCIHRLKPVGLVINNPYAYTLADTLNLKKMTGIYLNVFNGETAKAIGADYTVESAESVADRDIKYAFGYMPLMYLTHCPYKEIKGDKCAGCSYDGKLKLEDDKGMELIPMRIKLAHCYFKLCGANPVELPIERRYGKYFLDFFGQTEKESYAMLQRLENGTLKYNNYFRAAK